MKMDAGSGEGVVVEPIDVLSGTTAPHRELRLALAMRGGVSLAVWIGGAVSEIERLRRADEAGNEIYRELLGLNDYGDVVVDVLSGASAGGLNAVMYAAAQVHDFDIGELRDLWLRLGDIELLARDTTAGGRARSSDRQDRRIGRREALRPPSLLRGDEYFYRQLAEVLATKLPSGDAGEGSDKGEGGGVIGTTTRPRRPRIDLLLSATLFDAMAVRRVADRLTVIEDTRSQAMFRFRNRQDTTNFGPDELSTCRLGVAARTTSSFPGAFEPARISLDTAPDDPFDLTGVFEVPRREFGAATFHVFDGGVLDNIPVGAAIEAIVEAPADGPTERWLCYLHPSPSGRAAVVERRRSPRSVAALLRTVLTRFNQESLLEDLDELALVNDRLGRREHLRDTLLAPFAERTHGEVSAHVGAPPMRRRLRSLLAQYEAHRVRISLERPDRRGLKVGSPLDTLPASAQDQLARVIVAAQTGGLNDANVRSSVAFLTEVSDLLIAWARTIENQGDEAQRRQAGSVKADLYDRRRQLESAVRDEAQVWCAAFRSREPEDAWAQAGVLEAAVREIANEVRGRHREQLGEMWAEMVASACRLAALDVADAPPFSLLRCDDDEMSDALFGVAMLLLPVRLLGTGPWSALRFVYVHGNAPTPLEFPRLRPNGAPADAPLTARDKLAGNELANFAAFLSATWRANDWMWGRLDAASILVSHLCDSRLLDKRPASAARLREFAGITDSDPDKLRRALCERLQRQILADELPVVSAAPASGIDAERAAAGMTPETYSIGRQQLADLSERRRTRVGMRLALITHAALRPGGSGPGAVLSRSALTIAKPFLLFAVFAVLAPARTFLALAVTAASIQATVAGAGDGADLAFDGWTSAVAAVAIGLAVVAGVTRRVGSTRVRQIGTTLGLGLGALFGLVAAILLLRDLEVGYTALTVCSAAIALVAGATIYRRLKDGVREWVFVLAWLLAAVVAVAGIWTGWSATPWDVAASTAEFRDEVMTLIVAAGVVSIVAGSWMRLWALAVATFVVVAVGLGSLTITDLRPETVLLVDARVWAWVAVVVLCVVYGFDCWRVGRYSLVIDSPDGVDDEDDDHPPSAMLVRWLLVTVGLVSIAIVSTKGWLSVSYGVWILIAVLSAWYAQVALVTFLPVLRSPHPLTVREDRATSASPAERAAGGFGSSAPNAATGASV